MYSKVVFVIYVLGIFFIQGCKKAVMFEEMSPKDTNLMFLNEITEDGRNNIMTYEYAYNGGGVAVGDLNNNGLIDIYFVGNSVPNKLFLNQGDWKFKDVSKEAGVEGRQDWATGVTIVDINGDGYLDIYVSYSGNSPEEGYNKPVIKDYKPRANELYINNGVEKGGVPTFTESAEKYGIDAVGTFSTQAYFFDYDLDGDLDMFLLNHANMFYSAFYNVQKLRNSRHPYFGNKLFRNDNNKFVEVTESSGIHGSGLNFGLSASISDINKDGWPDIYVTNDYEEQDFLYLNNHDGTFKEVSHIALSHLSKYGMGSDIADINNDALPDIFVADMLPEDNYRQKVLKGADKYDQHTLAVNSGYHHQYMRNTLQLNRGLATDSLPRFSEIAQISGISNTDWSWAVLFADFDNDGLKDLFVTNGYLRDVSNLDFVNSTANKEISRANANNETIDLLPLIKTMPSTKISNYSFKNINGLQFENSTEDWGLDKKSVSNAVVYADLDNDGDLDLIINNLNEPATVYKNNQEITGKNNFIKIQLKGEGANTFGLGSKLSIVLDNGKELYYEAYYTRGYISSVEPAFTVGLGKASQIEEVEVIWPDKRVSRLQEIKGNQTIVISQKDAVEQVEPQLNIEKPLIIDVTSQSGLDFEHKENDYVDFLHHRLLPYQLSRLGGTLSIGDINGDGNDDVFFGGAAGQSGQLYLGEDDGTLTKLEDQAWERDKNLEDVGALFFDANANGYLDLYVVSGGNEKPQGSSYYQDRLYINDGKGNFTKSENSLPEISFSGGVVTAADYDKDGDLDLFIGGRHTAHNFPFIPKSILLKNETKNGIVKFSISAQNEISNVGMVTDAVWADVDNDSWLELILVGEWMPVTVLKNVNGKLKNITEELGLKNTIGWWSSIAANDYDGDGDIDLMVGNAGINSQFRASEDEPMTYYVQDINKDGKFDPILSYYIQGENFPFPGRDELLGQVTSLRKEYTTYDKFARATMNDVLKAGNVSSSSILEINNLTSSYLENMGNGRFEVTPLPVMAQLSAINGFIYDDFTGDGSKDIIAAGNFYPYQVNLGRSDASKGIMLNITDDGLIEESNKKLWLSGDVRDLGLMQFNNGAKKIIISRNNEKASLYEYTSSSNLRQ